MKINQVIAKADTVCPNGYDDKIKIEWLSQCEAEIYENIILTHEGAEKHKFDGYGEENLETELIVPAPYDDLYVYYIEAQIGYATKEMVRYNNAMSMFNSAVSAFRNYYNGLHKHLSTQKFTGF